MSTTQRDKRETGETKRQCHSITKRTASSQEKQGGGSSLPISIQKTPKTFSKPNLPSRVMTLPLTPEMARLMCHKSSIYRINSNCRWRTFRPSLPDLLPLTDPYTNAPLT